jgi:hypothetical protein
LLVGYLARLHSEKKDNPVLYRRHIRDLIGHGEMLMGVIDTYPDIRTLDFTTPEEIERIETEAVKWRNKIKFKSHRLSRIHGDFPSLRKHKVPSRRFSHGSRFGQGGVR